VSIGGGKLHLALKKEASRGMDYTGAGVISKRSFKYGYYEARFKCPPGKGWHTSFWMMFHNASGGAGTKKAQQEIDVCEQDSVKKNGYAASLHSWSPKHKVFGPIHVKTPDLSADFHVWGCEFTPKEVRYFFDGKEIGTRDATVLTHGEQSIWLTSIASSLGGTDKVDDSRLPTKAVFDYVRFFEKRD
jgi:beta-glucanase (GH16 family)